MTALAPILQSYFTDHLMAQRKASPHTVASYRDTFKLLLTFAHQRTGRYPHQLDIADLTPDLVTAFLHHLEADRGNTARTRNTRLAAVHSLFRYASLRAPEHADLIARIMAIPAKRTERTIVDFLTSAEIDAILAVPDRATWTGRRDHALLHLLAQTGLRVSELTSLTRQDLHLGTGPHVRCHGKGRKDRCTPLTRPTVKVLATWLAEHHHQPHDPLFTSRRGGTLSRDAIERLVTKHTATAARTCPTLQDKNVSPHTLRHSAAMALLHAGVDITVIALWLGHESTQPTQVYLHADLTLKERALARTTPANAQPGRYQAPDTLLAFLADL